MIIGVDKGHTKSGPNYGSVGILKESEETREVGDLLIKYLKELGHTVVDVTVDYASSNNDSINQRVRKANSQNLDLLVSIHFNASENREGHGVEAFTYNGNYIEEADRILKNIEKLGYRNRGIKNGTSPRRLGVVNSTKAKAILIECMFIDNKNDVDRYYADTMARAIAEGITNQKLGDETVKDKNTNEPSDWAKDSWEWAKKKGITDGTNPRNSVTREQAISMIHRAIGEK